MHANRGCELERPGRPARPLRRGWSLQRLRWVIILAWLPAPWLLIQGLRQPWSEQRLPGPAAGQQRPERLASGGLSPSDSGHRLMLDLNQVPHDHLTLLPGVGPALAERIVRYRQAAGRFETLQDLRQVEGIGPVLTDQLTAYLFVDPPPLSRQEHAQSQ